jgi:hypothetical protein
MQPLDKQLPPPHVQVPLAFPVPQVLLPLLSFQPGWVKQSPAGSCKLGQYVAQVEPHIIVAKLKALKLLQLKPVQKEPRLHSNYALAVPVSAFCVFYSVFEQGRRRQVHIALALPIDLVVQPAEKQKRRTKQRSSLMKVRAATRTMTTSCTCCTISKAQ